HRKFDNENYGLRLFIGLILNLIEETAQSRSSKRPLDWLLPSKSQRHLYGSCRTIPSAYCPRSTNLYRLDGVIVGYGVLVCVRSIVGSRRKNGALQICNSRNRSKNFERKYSIYSAWCVQRSI